MEMYSGNANIVDRPGAALKQVDIFDELRQAQARYHQACNNVQTAQIERSDAEQALHKISDIAARQISSALSDPTVPQATQQCQQFPSPAQGVGRY